MLSALPLCKILTGTLLYFSNICQLGSRKTNLYWADHYTVSLVLILQIFAKTTTPVDQLIISRSKTAESVSFTICIKESGEI